MDFDDAPEEAAFRAEARSWLAAHAAPKRPTQKWSIGLGDADPEAELAEVRRSKAWQTTLFEGGWAGITWPKEFGGRGGTPIQAMIFSQELSHFDVPQSVFAQGIGMAGPTIVAYGTPEQKERFLPPLLRGEEVWCQLFSEPGAGSDLANLTTSAVRDAGEFVVNGQKVWTSSAHFSDWAMLLARTDFDAPKHHGISYFLVDMATPGIEVRPLRQATGTSHFNEVFLTDVRIPAENVVGPINEGWRVATTTLTNERAVIAGGGPGRGSFEEICELARHFGRERDPVVRQMLSQVYISFRLLQFLNWRIQTTVAQGRQPGPESSIVKLALSKHLSLVGDLVMELQGAYGALFDYQNPSVTPWQLQFLGQWGPKFGGGTDQVQRNIVAERVIGLPREPQVDKEVSFRESLLRGGNGV